MQEDTSRAVARSTSTDWKLALSQYLEPNHRKAIWQLFNTFVPFIALWALMLYLYLSGYSYWLVLPLTVPTAGFFIRIFIFFHDCCHDSFFASRRANRILGYICGIITYTPFEDWQFTHTRHHATSGHLDRRGIGDVWTWTVDEYLSAPWLQRLAYRLYRHPIILFGFAPMVLFVIINRFSHAESRKRERRSVLVTNLAIAAVLVLAHLTIGIGAYLAIQVPTMFVATFCGVWLFYVQHQYEGVRWSREDAWNPIDAALQGSSYYKLPKVLQWFTGNIGLHHVHHVRADIPNYHLQACCNDIPVLREVEPVNIRKSLKSLWLNLWDEQGQTLVSFRALKSYTPPIAG